MSVCNYHWNVVKFEFSNFIGQPSIFCQVPSSVSTSSSDIPLLCTKCLVSPKLRAMTKYQLTTHSTANRDRLLFHWGTDGTCPSFTSRQDQYYNSFEFVEKMLGLGGRDHQQYFEMGVATQSRRHFRA